MKTKRNNKGFTLVELLAVIVILAIIMVIAIPTVLDTMRTTKIKSFKEYAMKVSNKAQETYTADQLIANPGSCVLYKIGKDIGLSSTGDYKGYVVVKNTNNETKVLVTLNDNDFMVYAADYNKLDNLDLQSYDSTSLSLSEQNILSVAGCSEYTEKKEETNALDTNIYENKTITISEEAKSSTQKLFTGEKMGEHNWVGVYVNGEITECYNKEGDQGKDYLVLNNGNRSNYCTNQVYSTTNFSVCEKAKSTICCTTKDDGSVNTTYTYVFNENQSTDPKIPHKTCGYLVTKHPSGAITWAVARVPSGNLPASGVYED